MILDRVRVADVHQLTPSFVRVTLAGEALADLGVDGPWFDQRIKLVFPGTRGLPPLAAPDGGDLWGYWRTLGDEYGAMRTYSVRDAHGEGVERRLVVDVVAHPGATGPGADWLATAAPDDEVALVAPRRGEEFGGIEFRPPQGAPLLLVGDETAVPAVARILADLPPDAVGQAFLEVPLRADVHELEHPAGVHLTWLPREGAEHGQLVVRAVTAHLGTEAVVEPAAAEEVDPDLWETPANSASYSAPNSAAQSSASEELGAGAGAEPELYAWIAGESRMVTTLRRHLVRDLGFDRRRVAFMGYWRQGVAHR